MSKEETQTVEKKESALAPTRTPPLSPEEDVVLNTEVLRQERASVAALGRQRKARVLIASGRSAHEQCPVMVGVNGRSFLIERDKEVLVPESVVHALELAVEQVPVLETDNGGNARIQGFRAAPRFPVRVLGYEEPATGEPVR